MLFLLLLVFVTALPLLTGIYYTTVGYAKKRRQTLITGIVLIVAWIIIMFYVSDSLYQMYTTVE